MKHTFNLKTNTLLLCMLLWLGSCKAESAITTPATGSWKMTITAPGIGEIMLVMDCETYADSTGVYRLEAYSETAGAKKLLGGSKAMLAKTFTKKFPKGSLVHIKGRYKTSDSIASVLYTPMRNFYLYATVEGNEMSGVLMNGKKEIVGLVQGEKGQHTLPLRNYKKHMDEILALTEDKIYDPAIIQSKEWKKYRKQMEEMSAACNDDALFIMAFHYRGEDLPFTHYSLYRYAEEVNFGNDDAANVTIEEKAPGVAYMKVSSFAGTAEEMDTAFMQIVDKGYHTLIVDLRNNGGGSVGGGLGFTRHLMLDTLDGGVFLTQRWFRNHKGLPEVADYGSLVPFSQASYSLIMKGIHEHEGLCLKLVPQAPLYTGKLYVLVNGNTASTCEPIVYGLKQRKRATIVGERTAGAMLNGETFSLGEDFKMVIPTATYYTSDGVKLDGLGVAPDKVVKSEEALNAVLTELNIKN